MQTASKTNDNANANDSKESVKFFLFKGGQGCHPSILAISLPHEFQFRMARALDLKRFLMRTIKQRMRDTLEEGIKLMEKHPEDYSRVFSSTTPTYGDSNHEPTEAGILELLARAYYELKSGMISQAITMSQADADHLTMMSDIKRANREKHWTDKPQGGLAHSRIFQYVYL
jgi:hypothetical protein